MKLGIEYASLDSPVLLNFLKLPACVTGFGTPEQKNEWTIIAVVIGNSLDELSDDYSFCCSGGADGRSKENLCINLQICKFCQKKKKNDWGDATSTLKFPFLF